MGVHVVTGAFGYTGRSIAEKLLARGESVRTLTNSPDRPNEFGGRVEVAPLKFDCLDELARSLDGAEVLYNTYWVRFNHRLFTFDDAVRKTNVLFDAARLAGVRRIVHVSILHASEADDLGYYRGKHELERALRACGVPHAIIRPGVLFGRFDVLVNNIAWVIRRMPVFGVFGDGSYCLRPLHVDDMAELMIDHAGRDGNTEAEAVGPERFTFRGLVEELARIMGARRWIFGVPPGIGLGIARLLNTVVKDVVITREEVVGLMRGLLDSDAPAAGPTKLTEWARENRDQLGVRYANEVGRRVHRKTAYALVK